MSEPYVIFSHGKDGAPWGAKIMAMAQVARGRGFAVDSVDYRGIEDPARRVAKLLAACQQLNEPVVLVGSSLGGHLAAAVSTQVPTRGMFLLAPAFFMPGYEKFTPEPARCPISIVHGWNDEIVPVANSIRFAQQYQATLQLIDSDHRLMDSIGAVCEYFEFFLNRLPANVAAAS